MPLPFCHLYIKCNHLNDAQKLFLTVIDLDLVAATSELIS